jgi:hypothetical protein
VKELAAGHRTLRLTPDKWTIPLFGEPDTDGKRDMLEGRLVCIAMEALCLRTSAVLDFGLWGPDKRSALHGLARSAVHHLRWSACPLSRRTPSSPGSHIARHPRRTGRTR